MRNIAVVPILNDRVIHTIEYKFNQYIGEPSNIVRQLSNMGADEIFIVDVSNRMQNKRYLYSVNLDDIAKQATCPLVYGGELYLDTDVKRAVSILGIGFEKIVCATAVHKNPKFFKMLSEKVGIQSVVAAIELDRYHYRYEDVICDMQFLEPWVGEFLICDVYNNGAYCGMDASMFILSNHVQRPVVFYGGWKGEIINHKVDAIAASTHYMMYQNNPMVNYESHNRPTLQ